MSNWTELSHVATPSCKRVWEAECPSTMLYQIKLGELRLKMQLTGSATLISLFCLLVRFLNTEDFSNSTNGGSENWMRYVGERSYTGFLHIMTVQMSLFTIRALEKWYHILGFFSPLKKILNFLLQNVLNKYTIRYTTRRHFFDTTVSGKCVHSSTYSIPQSLAQEHYAGKIWTEYPIWWAHEVLVPAFTLGKGWSSSIFIKCLVSWMCVPFSCTLKGFPAQPSFCPGFLCTKHLLFRAVCVR